MIYIKRDGNGMLSENVRRAIHKFIATRKVTDGFRVLERAEQEGAPRSELRAVLYREGVSALAISALESLHLYQWPVQETDMKTFLEQKVLETHDRIQRQLEIDTGILEMEVEAPAPSLSLDDDDEADLGINTNRGL
jgi:hypothetical protein